MFFLGVELAGEALFAEYIGDYVLAVALGLAFLDWFDWYNEQRLHSGCGDIPPGEYEDHSDRRITTPATAKSADPSRH